MIPDITPDQLRDLGEAIGRGIVKEAIERRTSLLWSIGIDPDRVGSAIEGLARAAGRAAGEVLAARGGGR